MSYSADVGRLNRANITKDRYDPPSSPFEPPTYRASLYDIDAPDHAKPTSAPQFRLEYRRSLGSSERTSRLSNSATMVNEDYSPPPPPSSRYKRATLLARELRAANASAYVSSPERYPSPKRQEDWHSEPSIRMEEYSSFNRFSYLAEDEIDLHIRPRSVRAAAAARLSSSSNGAAHSSNNNNNSFLKQELNRSFDSIAYNHREEDARAQLKLYDHTSHVVSPIRSRRSVSEKETSLGELLRERPRKRTQDEQVKDIPVKDEIINQSDIDKLVIAALKLQDQGCFDEAHFLLQKVERFRKERMEKTDDARPRRASLVLEEARKNLQTAGPSRLEESVLEEEYQHEEFESLSDIEETKQQQGSLLGGGSSSILQKDSDLSSINASHQRQFVEEDLQAKSANESSISQQPIVMIPVAHVEASVLEEERERRKREIRSKRKATEQPAPSEEAATTEISGDVQATPVAHMEEKSNVAETTTTRTNHSLQGHHSEEEQEVIKELTATLSKKFSLESTAVQRGQQPQRLTEQRSGDKAKMNGSSPSAGRVNEQHAPQGRQDQLLNDKADSKQVDNNKQDQLKKQVDDDDDVDRTIQQSLALTFPDTSFERLNVDPEEATKTLEELERKRRQEEMLNPTKSSRLPSVFGRDSSPTKKNKEQQPPYKEGLFGVAGYTAKQGYLMKWMENPRFTFYSGSYHKRYFILTGGVLLHLKTKESKIPRGMIALDECRVQISQCKGIHAEYCVTVQAPTRNYTLFPDSRKEAVEWAVAIEHNANVLARMREEEESRTRQLARMKLSETKMIQHSSNMLSTFDPKQLIGQDVTSDDFKDLSQLTQTASSSSSLPQEGSETQQPQPQQPSSSTGVNALGIGAYYDMLGVPANASTDAIRKAYHRLAKMFHPDKNTSIDTEKFALINRAFHVVQDPETREKYNLGERVKHALRRGVLVKIHDEDDGDSWSAAFYIGPTFTVIYWQDAEFGPVLRPAYQFAELRFVQEVIAGEDDETWTWARRNDAGKRCLVIKGQRLGHDHIRLELDTEESRDEVLDGLRHLRCEQSMLFVQKLEKWLADGNR